MNTVPAVSSLSNIGPRDFYSCREIAIIGSTVIDPVCLETKIENPEQIPLGEFSNQPCYIANCGSGTYEMPFTTTQKEQAPKTKYLNTVPEEADWKYAAGGISIKPTVAFADFAEEPLTGLLEDVQINLDISDKLRDYLISRINFLIELLNRKNIIKINLNNGQTKIFRYDNTAESRDTLEEEIAKLEPEEQEIALNKIRRIENEMFEEAKMNSIVLKKYNKITCPNLVLYAALSGDFLHLI